MRNKASLFFSGSDLYVVSYKKFRVVVVTIPELNLGSVSDNEIKGGCLVTNCYTSMSYLFSGSPAIPDSFIRRKLGGKDSDYPDLANLVRSLVIAIEANKQMRGFMNLTIISFDEVLSICGVNNS